MMLTLLTKIKMVKILKDREMVFLSPRIKIRGLMANHTKFLDRHFSRYSVDKNDVDIYYSLAKLKKIPVMSYNPQQRKEQMGELDSAYEEIYSFDYGWDFDNVDKSVKGFNKAKKEVIKVMTFFDSYNIPYNIRFSGSGFHLVVPEIEGGFEHKNFPQMMGTLYNVAEKVKNILELETLDLSVYDIRRIWRLPFTINTKTGKVALPLNKRQFKDYHWEDYNVDNFKENQNMYKIETYNDLDPDKNKKLFIQELGGINEN